MRLFMLEVDDEVLGFFRTKELALKTLPVLEEGMSARITAMDDNVFYSQGLGSLDRWEYHWNDGLRFTSGMSVFPDGKPAPVDTWEGDEYFMCPLCYKVTREEQWFDGHT